MARYHINPNNQVSECRARTPDGCRFAQNGQIPPHYNSKEEAYRQVEKIEEKKYGLISTISTKSTQEEEDSVSLANFASSDRLSLARERVLVLSANGLLGSQEFRKEQGFAKMERESYRKMVDKSAELQRLEHLGKQDLPPAKKEDLRRRWRDTNAQLQNAQNVWVKNRDRLEACKNKAVAELRFLGSQREALQLARSKGGSTDPLGKSLVSRISDRAMRNNLSANRFQEMYDTYTNGSVQDKKRVVDAVLPSNNGLRAEFGHYVDYVQDREKMLKDLRETRDSLSKVSPDSSDVHMLRRREAKLIQRLENNAKMVERYGNAPVVVDNMLKFAKLSAQEARQDVSFAENALKKN